MEEKCILDPQRDCIGKAEAEALEEVQHPALKPLVLVLAEAEGIARYKKMYRLCQALAISLS